MFPKLREQLSGHETLSRQVGGGVLGDWDTEIGAYSLTVHISRKSGLPVHFSSLANSSEPKKQFGVPSHNFDNSNNCNTSVESLT